MRAGTKTKIWVAACLGACWLTACRGGGAPSASTSAPAAASATPIVARVLSRPAPFDHRRAEHRRLACNQCHHRDERRPAEPVQERPYHDACNGCHTQELYLRTAAPAPFCRVCHGQEAVLGASESVVLASFPTALRQFGLKPFSHRKHADPKRLPEGAQKALACDACHRFDAGQQIASFPGHAECYACHVHTAGQKLGNCGDCHAPPETAMRFAHGPDAAGTQYNFHHATHFKQKSIGMNCARCHAPVAPADETQSDLARIRTVRGQRHQSACWKCHVQEREPVCTKCHIGGAPNFR